MTSGLAAFAFEPATSIFDFALARYKPNGALDAGFSGDGKTTTDLFGGPDGGKGIALHEDGKIVVAGGAESTAGDENFGLARYLGG